MPSSAKSSNACARAITTSDAKQRPDKHPEDKPLKDALEKIFAGPENADQLGSLLQIAEPVEKELRAIKEQEDKKQLAYLGSKQRTLFDAQPQSKAPGMKQFDIAPQTVLPVGVENWDTWRTQTGKRLRTHFAEEAEAADLGQQFFSAQASRGWRLFELLGRRYDVVAANPPYMGSKNMGPVLRKYVGVADHDALPPWPAGSPNLADELHAELLPRNSKQLPPDELRTLKQKLHSLYEAGPGGEAGEEDTSPAGDEDEEESLAGARIPIPAETFLEELSQKLEIHPLSIYWLLKEGIEKEGWRCIPEEQRFVTDQFTVTILRLLGHRWPRQVEAGEAVPDWADQDGIIPITAGTQETTLYDRVRARIAADFPDGDVASIGREFAEIMGKPLDRWLETEFFKHHTQQFKKRPIAWQLQSSKFTAKRKPAFACLLYYHKLDGDTLPKLRSQYVGPLRQRLETELRGIEAVPKEGRSDRQQSRLRELADQLTELRDFDKRLEQVHTSGFAFAKLAEQLRAESIDELCSPDGIRPPPADQADFLRQEQRYLPDINDGVRVNITPLQQAGLLAADVLAGKDLDKAITDRATWRSDERRWSRAGKLPQPGYFRVKPQPSKEGAAA